MRMDGTATTRADPLSVLLASGAVGLATDAQLVERFLERRDEAAFAMLVDRHGAMVLRACLAVLGDLHEAQDAWQATFLILSRRAGSIRRTDSVGSWLFGVARRVSFRARTETRRRRDLTAKLAAITPLVADPPESWAELHEEIDRLPSLERAAIIVCDLECLTHDAAAQRLCWPVRTVRKRLYRGRDRLRARLTRRGLTLAPSLAGALLLPQAARAALARSAAASPRALSLAQGVSRAMMLSSWKMAVAVVAACGSLCLGGVWALGGQDHPKKEPAAKPLQAAKAASTQLTDADARSLLRKTAEGVMALGKVPLASSSLVVIARAQTDAADREGAKRTLLRATELAIGTDGKPDSWELWRAGDQMVLIGEKEEARVILRRAAKATIEGPEKHPRGFSKTMILATILRSQAKAGDKDGVKETLEVLKAIYKAADLTRNPWDEWKFVGALAAAGAFDDAFAIIGNMRADESRKSYAPHALSEIAEATEVLDRATALKIVKQLDEMLEALGGPPNAKVHAVVSLAQAQARVGEIAAARSTATSIGEDPNGGPDSTETQPYALLVVALAQLQTGDLNGARETLRLGYHVLKTHPKMRGLAGRASQIANGQVMAGDLDGASRTMALADPGGRHEILALIALSRRLRGEETTAKAIFAEALEDATDRVDNPPKPAGNVPVVKGRKSLTDEERKEQNRIFATTERAYVQAMSGDTKNAKNTVSALLQSNQSSALSRVAAGVASTGDLAEAVAMALAIKEPDQRRSALEGVAFGYQQWKLLTRASKR